MSEHEQALTREALRITQENECLTFELNRRNIEYTRQAALLERSEKQRIVAEAARLQAEAVAKTLRDELLALRAGVDLAKVDSKRKAKREYTAVRA